MTTRVCQLCVAMFLISLPHSIARADDPERKPVLITGRVVDSAGQPIKGAMCFWVWAKWSNWGAPAGELVSQAVSDADGRFELKEHEAAARDVEQLAVGMLWFIADGYAVQWQTSEQLPPTSSDKRTLNIVLKPARKFSYRVVGPDGRPRLGELIEPVQLNAGKNWISPPRPVRELLSGTTDELGLFTVNSLAAEDGMLVRVMSQQLGTIAQMPNAVLGMPPTVTVKLRSVGAVEGVLEGPGVEAFAGRTIQVSTCTRDQDPRFPEAGMADATIDTKGRFRVPLIAEGDITINLDCPLGIEFERKTPPVWGEVLPGRTTKISVSVVRMIPIRGRVRMADGSVPTGEGVVVIPENGRHREIRISFRAGNPFFSGSAYPGDITLQAELRMINDVPVVRRTVMAQTVLKVDKDAPEVQTPDLSFPKVRIVEGQALGTNGQPLAGAAIYASFGKGSGTQIKTDTNGRFQYAVGDTTPVGSYLLMRDERTLVPLDKTDDPLIIRMPRPTDDSTGH